MNSGETAAATVLEHHSTADGDVAACPGKNALRAPPVYEPLYAQIYYIFIDISMDVLNKELKYKRGEEPRESFCRNIRVCNE